MKNIKAVKRLKRHVRIRQRVKGTAERPRLVVFRSLKRNYLQLIDDSTGKTLAAHGDKVSQKGSKTERAKTAGVELAKKALEKGVKTCIFDRGGYKYHGRVKAMAEGAREGGLKF